jgi:hypothetical protein
VTLENGISKQAPSYISAPGHGKSMGKSIEKPWGKAMKWMDGWMDGYIYTYYGCDFFPAEKCCF